MKRLNQEGAVAIISVVIFITIITIVVSAYLVSAISQQRTAVNFDMGTRAYYAAESGVQDAVRHIAADPTADANKTDCKPYDNGGALGDAGKDYGVNYTCQIVSSKPTEITGNAIPNEVTAMFRLDPANPSGSINANPLKLVVRWSKSSTSTPANPGGAAAETLVPRDPTTKPLPQITNWKNANNEAYHAMIRLNVLSHPKGAFTGSEVTQHVVFLNPATTADPILTIYKDTQLSQEALITNAQCRKSSEVDTYACEAVITLSGYGFNLQTNAVYVRVGALYRSTDFSVQLLDGPTPLTLTNAQATIDVTGRAKDVYRRVKQTFPIKGGYFEDKGPDAAVIAGEGICKLFSITDKTEDFSANCNPLQP